MADDLSEKIAENASGPKQVSGDVGTVAQHNIADQIAADKYLSGKQAMRNGRAGIRIFRIAPGGAVNQ